MLRCNPSSTIKHKKEEKEDCLRVLGAKSQNTKDLVSAPY
jgi:hypothetical protein